MTDGPSDRDPERVLFLFSLRDPLPLGADGWNVVAHAEECGGEGSSPNCLTGGRCYATSAKFVAFEDIDLGLVQGTADITAAADDILGRARQRDALPYDAGMPSYRWVLATSTPVFDSEDHSERYARSFTLAADAVAALRQATGAPIPDLTIERVQPLYLSGHTTTGGEAEIHQLVVVEHVPFGPLAPATEEQIRRAERFLVARRNGHPVELYTDHKLAARRAAHSVGDYGVAVLAAATAAEVLIKHAAWMLTYEASLADTDPAPHAATTELGEKKPAQLLSGVLGARLGGTWDSGDPEAPVGAWRHHVAQGRNRLLHRGTRCTAVEASDAVWALGLLEAHVMDRLAAKATVYPRTAHTLLGSYGLSKRGIDSEVAAILDGLDDTDAAFLARYRTFVRDLDEAAEVA